MNTYNPYKDFTDRLKLLSNLITTTLSNIGLIGNKTHGDLAEIAEFINQYMYDC